MPHTLVRHTGFSVSVGGKVEFQHAVEEASISTTKEERAVRRAGGLIYKSYSDARSAADTYNYQGHEGIIPPAAGKFVRRSAFAEEIFIPNFH